MSTEDIGDPRDAEGHLERRRVLAALDGVERLAAHPDAGGQLALGHLAAMEAQRPDAVVSIGAPLRFHPALRLAIPLAKFVYPYRSKTDGSDIRATPLPATYAGGLAMVRSTPGARWDCAVCGDPVPPRRRQYCSNACYHLAEVDRAR